MPFSRPKPLEVQNHTVTIKAIKGKRIIRVMGTQTGVQVTHYLDGLAEGSPIARPIPEKDAARYRKAVAKHFGITESAVQVNVKSSGKVVIPKKPFLERGVLGDFLRSRGEKKAEKMEFEKRLLEERAKSRLNRPKQNKPPE